MNEAANLARAGVNFEGIYASPQSSRSGSLSELGLTLLPSTSHKSGSNSGENHGYGSLSLQPRGVEGPQTSEGLSERPKYPTPTSTPASFQLEILDDAAKNLVTLSNSEHNKQFSSTIRNSSTAPLFVPLRPIDRAGRPHTGLVTPTYITTPLQYRPSAPHLHTLVSTGTTMAAVAQLDHLQERNRLLTLERDRYYHLSKPATLRADDVKLEQIRQLQAELRVAREQNGGLQAALDHQTNLGDIQRLQAELRNITEQSHRLQWMLQHQKARTNHAEALAAQRTEECRKLMVAYNILINSNRPRSPNSQNMPLTSPTIPHDAEEDFSRQESNYIDLTSPKKPIMSQQGGTQKSRAPSTPATPEPTAQDPSSASATSLLATVNHVPPPVLVDEPRSTRKRTGSNEQKGLPSEHSSKRQRTNSNTDKRPAIDQPSKGQRNGSTVTEKQARKQHSMLNRSHFNEIQARVRSALKGRTGNYSWLQENWSNKEEYAHSAKLANGVDVADGAQPTNQASPRAEEDELSESEIAAFDKALEDAWDEDENREGDGDGDGDSLFGDLVLV